MCSEGDPGARAKKAMSAAEAGVRVLFGIPFTRTSHCIWLFKEIGLECELRMPALMGSDDAEFDAASHGMKRQPTFRDADGTTLIESLAINLHVLQQHGDGGSGLAPRTPAEQAALLQWSFFTKTELDQPLFQLLFCGGPGGT